MYESVQVLLLKEADIQIMKALGDMAPDENPSENNIARKTEKPRLSTPTVRRRLTALVENEYVSYLGKGKQRSNRYRLELKGLFYLLLKSDELNDLDMSRIAERILCDLVAKRKMKSMLRLLLAHKLADALTDSIESIKPKINFDHFDKNYASQLFMEALLEGSINIAANVWDYAKEGAKNDAATTFKALKHDPLLNEFLTAYFEDMFDIIKKNKETWEIRYAQWEKLLKLWKEGKGKEAYPRGREHDTIHDLYQNGMLGSEGWKKPRGSKKGSE